MLGAAVLTALASPAAAQVASKWEIEIHGGAAAGNSPTGGDGTLPVAGTPFTTLALQPSRRASSWYLGDGAALLNAVNAAFPTGGRIAPLDPVLTQSATARSSGAAFGVRVGYAITRRFGAEFSLDVAARPLRFTNAFLDGVETTRASFTAAWDGLIATGGGFIFTAPNITSTSDIKKRGGRQLVTNGVLVINLPSRGAILTYATVGAGLVANEGAVPTVTLTGNYRFTSLNGLAPNSFTVNETDVVKVRTAGGSSFTTVFGGGIKVMRSSRWGIRADVRAHVGAMRNDLMLSLTPNVATQAGGGAIASTHNPSMQFSSDPSTGFRSSLAGPAVDGFRVFHGSGVSTLLNLTAGVYFKF
jgi:hypothetical protein